MLEQYGVSGSMRDNPPLWSFRDVPSPSSISISIDGKFAGVGSKSGLVLVNQNGRAVWKNNKARRINDISISSQTGKLSVASGQKVIYLINKKGLTREDAYEMVQRNAMKVWKEKVDFNTLRK